jgi:hypothetical protein
MVINFPVVVINKVLHQWGRGLKRGDSRFRGVTVRHWFFFLLFLHYRGSGLRLLLGLFLLLIFIIVIIVA